MGSHTGVRDAIREYCIEHGTFDTDEICDKYGFDRDSIVNELRKMCFIGELKRVSRKRIGRKNISVFKATESLHAPSTRKFKTSKCPYCKGTVIVGWHTYHNKDMDLIKVITQYCSKCGNIIKTEESEYKNI